MKAGAASSVLLALLLALAGCHRWVPIKPTELPRLSRTAGWTQQPDGTTVELVEPFDVSVATRSGWQAFKHPIESAGEQDAGRRG
jgi:hypothetical protein